jgi:hypothetical protein
LCRGATPRNAACDDHHVRLRPIVFIAALLSTGCFQPELEGRACAEDADCITGWWCAADGCRQRCDADADCPPGRACEGGACVTPPPSDAGPARDAGEPPADAGGGLDAGATDAGIDAGPDADSGPVEVDGGPPLPILDGGTGGGDGGVADGGTLIEPDGGVINPPLDGGVVGVDGGPAAPRLLAVHPSVAGPGDLITLEGEFEGELTVRVTAGIVNMMTVVSVTDTAQHVELTLPNAVTYTDVASGTLRVEGAGGLSEALAFHVPPNDALLDPGTDFGPEPGDPHPHGNSCVVDNDVYLWSGGDTARVDRGMDGLVGPSSFAPLDGTAPADTRGASGLCVGDSLFLIGGVNNGTPSTNVYRMQLKGDAPEWTVDAQLTAGRARARAVVIGSYVYVLGGLVAGSLADEPTDTIERAVIQRDGSLGDFVPLATRLNTARHMHQVSVVAGRVYVLGGDGAQKKVERFGITPSGDLVSPQELPTPVVWPGLRGSASFVYSNKLCTFGGESDTFLPPSSSVYCGVADEPTWDAAFLTTLASGATRAPDPVLLDGRLWLFGGVSDAALGTMHPSEHTRLLPPLMP